MSDRWRVVTKVPTPIGEDEGEGEGEGEGVPVVGFSLRRWWYLSDRCQIGVR